MLLSDALEQVNRLLGGFPNGGANAGDGYIGALAATLCDYPRQVAVKCCNPVRGVSRETRFLPTVADLVGFCERETQAMRRPVEVEDRDAALRWEMVERREAEARLRADRARRPTLDDLRQKHGPGWGIDGAVRPSESLKATREQLVRANNATFERECMAFGIDPERGVSPSLVKLLAEHGMAARDGIGDDMNSRLVGL